MRGHAPIPLTKFKGLWSRGDDDDVPLDHLSACQNLQFIGDGLRTRDGVGISQTVAAPLENVKRIYNYPTTTANTLLVLTIEATGGNIYHVIDESTVFGPILTITDMEDFAFVPYAGRAYITPFASFTTGDLNIQKGIDGEFLYVYLGDGVAARKAAGNPVSGTMTVANGAAGYTDAGLHLFGVVYETDTGYLSPPGAFAQFTTVAAQSVSFGNIPTSGQSFVTKRHIVATKVITGFNGNFEGYDYFFIPGAVINDNVSTFLNNVSFYDQDLLDDASHLFDNFAEIPAGCNLALYHNRLCLCTTFDDISIVLVSNVGEPEAINEIDGLIVVPPDGNPITNIQELRDVFYVFKRARTVSYIDNGDVPSSWQMSDVDKALGTCVHGIATVLDSGSASVDFFIITTFAGILLFNGRYAIPELSWKIQTFWADQDRNEYRRIQIVNAPIQKWILVVLPDNTVLMGDFSDGMDYLKIRWMPWVFNVQMNTVGIVNIDEIVFGSQTYIIPT
jgi:hypothetical protein